MSRVYFIGIGGIGMSAIARYYLHQGWQVAGYDSTSTPLTQQLEQEGATVHYVDGVANIPSGFELQDTLVVYTPAVGLHNQELCYFQQQGNTVVKRAQALGVLSEHKTLLAVAGTHGKTTTSTMLAHIMTVAIGGCNAFLGGISKNYHTNLLLSSNECLVAEADEYDRSFLQLKPSTAIVTSVDADHLDIYNDAASVTEAFAQFAAKIREGGALITKRNLIEGGKPIFAPGFAQRLYSYAFDQKADFYASNIKEHEGGYFEFDLYTPDGLIEGCTLGVPGWINVENAVAASASAYLNGAMPEKIREALASFQGVKRRFDVQVRQGNTVYIDDYAHHPAELRASITSIRGMYPGRRITGVFQPHLYTRTRDFAEEFAQSLSLLDELVLLDIYPARELPIEGVDSGIIFDKVSLASKWQLGKDEVLAWLRKQKPEVLVTFGAGNIDTLVDPIREELERSFFS